MTTQLEKARDLLASHNAILFALLFGSMATGHAHPWSDVDIGVYVTTPLSLLEIGRRVSVIFLRVGERGRNRGGTDGSKRSER
jgi:predicted nucleotidyltransferase